MNSRNKTKFINIKVLDHDVQSCHGSASLQQTELPYVHFPIPQTFRRLGNWSHCFCSLIKLLFWVLFRIFKEDDYDDDDGFHREVCACNPVRYFAILSMQRSGSGWFETLLNSHMNVSSNGEIFSVRDRRLNISSILKTMDRVYNLDWFTSASKNECSAAVGFKWMLNQVSSYTAMEFNLKITQ